MRDLHQTYTMSRFSLLQEMRYVSSRSRVWTVDSVVRCLVITTATVAKTQQDATAREV